jgi:DNA-binding Xre family transcriptional regulator
MTLPEINIRADINRIRLEQEVTISELARVSGVSRANVSKCISGNSQFIHTVTLVKLLSALGITRITYHQGESKCITGRKKRTLISDQKRKIAQSRKCR